MLIEIAVVGRCGGLKEEEIVEGGFGGVWMGVVEAVKILEGGAEEGVSDASEAIGAVSGGAEALGEGEGCICGGEEILLLEVLGG